MSSLEERVKKIVVEQLGVKEEEVTLEASFVDDLGADSLDTVELVMALEEEFEANMWPESVIERVMSELKKSRVLQTATHLTVTEGPTFLAVHQMATAGLNSGVPYLVGAFSGVPFSNPAWSGCLNFSERFQVKDVLLDGARDLRSFERADADRRRDGVTGARRLSMVSAKNRDSLVFRAPAPDKMYDIIDQLRPSLKSMVPDHNDIFCEFALAFSQAVTRKALGRKQMWYFDLNEVVALYLQDVLPRPDHPLHRLMFDSELRCGLEAAIGERITWFYTAMGKDQRRYYNKVVADGDDLVGYGGQVPLVPEEVCLMLEMGLFCPGVLLTFAALAFVNGFKCLGSFEQVQYLEKYRKALSDLGWPKPGALDTVDTGALTSGRCVDEQGAAVFPLDVSLGLRWVPDKGQRVWDLVEPLIPRLVGKARG